MNIYEIKQQSVVLEEIGFAIDTPERMKLQLGLLRLSELANADQLLFWGKILTTGQSYYIAMSIDFQGHFSFPLKRFYYSNQNFIFQQFPQLDAFNKGGADKFNHLPFSGNPNNILINVQVEGEQKKQEIQKGQDSEDESVVKIIPKNFTELDRLNYVVRAIECQCQLAPVGAFKINQKHQIRYNQSFKGLKSDNVSLTDFYYFRYPQSEIAKITLQSPESIFKANIFDNIEKQNLWSIQVNTKGSFVNVRSLIWPGYLCYNFFGSKRFGGIYYGSGCKMTDLCFYL